MSFQSIVEKTCESDNTSKTFFIKIDTKHKKNSTYFRHSIRSVENTYNVKVSTF